MEKRYYWLKLREDFFGQEEILILFGIPGWLNTVCQVIILVTTVYSGVEYFWKNKDVFVEK